MIFCRNVKQADIKSFENHSRRGDVVMRGWQAKDDPLPPKLRPRVFLNRNLIVAFFLGFLLEGERGDVSQRL